MEDSMTPIDTTMINRVTGLLPIMLDILQTDKVNLLIMYMAAEPIRKADICLL